ncbi:mycofactocin biosynthesis glycosyltransferase MftF [uncultured Desulfobacter sp.]|uniref:mycofactocin biosynthesis glycosyltransferase MftF n=1 Tax=uncultured Desulfobacter sp. TaxID=240139 RepID=UPI0029F55D77|nr:mycofactocin biosynthesis glycosyltransferase MftF [uncultured Desulfobacter sp.]
MMTYRFPSQVELIEQTDGAILLKTIPLSVLRVNRACATLLKAMRDGGPVANVAQNTALFDQLAARGFLEQVQTVPESPQKYPFVSVIIPVRDREKELGRCLESLSALHYPLERLEVIVVDDGSKDNSAWYAKKWGAKVISSGANGAGPAAARNRGAAVANGEILAFIDSDCTASKEWFQQLVPLFDDATLAAVGGKVAGISKESDLDLYEDVMSSLCMGAHPRLAGKGADTFYLPSCNLLVKKDAFLDLNGFAPTMQVGEDVDLCWRLRDKGWRIAYMPAGAVFHKHRNQLWSFMSRRFFYGTSEEKLQRLHPKRKKQMVVPPLLAGLLFVFLTIPWTGGLGVLIAGIMAVMDSQLLKEKTQKMGVNLRLFQLLRARLRTMVSLLYSLSFHLVRYYSILMIVLGILQPLFIPVLLLMLGCAAMVDFSVKKVQLPFISFFFFYILEQLSYGLGVFWGCVKGMNFRSYVVVLRRHIDG